VPRTLLWCAALAVAALPARGEQTITSTETLIRLTVEPAPAPKPALRYILLPELREMTPGNPIPNYLTAFLDPDSANQDVPGPAALRQADRAARMDKPDWQILLKAKADGINLLLPDVQKLRALAAGLQARFRDEVALHRFDDALGTAKTMFAMSRHLSENPTVIADLVGIAIAFIAIGPLEEMLEQPGCPNLYWALTDLPNPLVPMDRGLEGERMFILAELGVKAGLDDRAPMTPAQLRKAIAYIDKLRELDQTSSKQVSTRAWLDQRTRDEKSVAAARARLVEFGLAADTVALFPPDQVILLDERYKYEVIRDEALKYLKLPTWECDALLSRPQPKHEPGLFDSLVPFLHKVRKAQGRLEQRIALLRHVEALRMYAADHDGKLPATLAEVSVPLPPDPYTGRPFRYSLEGGTAHIRGTPPKGDESIPAYNLHYEITVRK
jgi:hypothetical protein